MLSVKKNAKRDCYRHAFNRYSTNLQKTWLTINETLNSKKGKQDFPKEFKLRNDNTISEPKEIANAIDLFLRPCLCYQLQSIEQNMYVLL